MKKPEKIAIGLISPQVLADIGRAAFGVQWQPQLARALKVPEQHIRRWTNDGAPVDNLAKLRLILSDRTDEITRMARLLDVYDVKD